MDQISTSMDKKIMFCKNTNVHNVILGYHNQESHYAHLFCTVHKCIVHITGHTIVQYTLLYNTHYW